jgi:hypothetical protein
MVSKNKPEPPTLRLPAKEKKDEICYHFQVTLNWFYDGLDNIF